MAVPDLKTLSTTLDLVPCVFRGNRLNLLFVEDVHEVSPASLTSDLSAPRLFEERRLVLGGQPAGHGYPTFSVAARPDPSELSRRLFSQFEQASRLLQTQSGLSQLVFREALVHEPDVVAFVVVDGLSYYDLDESLAAPCLVEGPSITENGFRQAIGRPSVGQRLFELGYKHQHAFTYFDRASNPLASDLHKIFGATQVSKIREFSEILASDVIRTKRSYIQVTMPGLDALSHSHRDRPPIAPYISLVLERFGSLIKALESNKRKVLAFLTADHGILWRDAIESPELVNLNAVRSDSNHPRYLLGTAVRDYTRIVRMREKTFSLLGYPHLTRRLRSTEWGVHGGISAWESIVPLITYAS